MILFLKSKLIWIVLSFGALLIALFSSGLYSNMLSFSDVAKDSSQTASISTDGRPAIVKTVPDSLDQATILPTQVIELTFSQTLENLPETRWEVQPAADIKSELSDDKKTLRLIPSTPFNLGQSYTLFIRPETKLEGKKTLEEEYIYHFKTIEFKGS